MLRDEERPAILERLKAFPQEDPSATDLLPI